MFNKRQKYLDSEIKKLRYEFESKQICFEAKLNIAQEEMRKRILDWVDRQDKRSEEEMISRIGHRKEEKQKDLEHQKYNSENAIRWIEHASQVEKYLANQTKILETLLGRLR